MKAPVNETLFVGFLAVVLLLWQEHQNEKVLDAIHIDGVAVGYQLAINANVPTNETCMAFWFGGDTKRVGKAIQQVKLEANK